ncbi:hypothetical protein [Novosphingobium profundi]|uniref:hypothetical protein n=1 Tax=Novosphingobium profundi TaxID=1774954 RepID=UPI0031BB5363
MSIASLSRVHSRPRRFVRPSRIALLTGIALAGTGSVLAAQDNKNAAFELSGPALLMQVTRGGKTLPIAQVPNLQAGDTITMHLPLPSDKDGDEKHGKHDKDEAVKDRASDFLLVTAFLRGAVNPPPDQWIHSAQGWKSKAKDNTLELTVPEGARQMVSLLVPRTQGAEGVLEDAVQGKPGEFVRAGGELYEASLDHARLETFMGSIRAQGDRNPEALRKVAPVLASSLGIKLQKDCLDKVLEEQASCLVEGRSSLVLSDLHTSSLADTLTGTPTDLALQLSATPQAGSGTYSAYIGVARDIARLLGAFNNPQFGYLPALAMRRKDELSLLLNTAPSFAKPKSVMVVGMPAIEADVPPQLRAKSPAPICAVQGSVVLPVEGAPLVFATDFAHAMALRVTASDGKSLDIPVAAQADRGGYVFDSASIPKGFTGSLRAHLHGQWGFAPFEGPDFVLQRPDGSDWQPVGEEGALVLGRDSTALLAGGAPGCVSAVTLEPEGAVKGAGAPRALEWSVKDNERLAVPVPLKDARPGPVRLTLHLQGVAQPVSVTLDTRAETSRIDALELHEGDRLAELSGQRLDQVRKITAGSLVLAPVAEGLERSDGLDVLRLAVAGGELPKAGTPIQAQVELASGRTIALATSVAPPRPSAHVLSRSVRLPAPMQGERALVLTSDDFLPAGGELVFSLEGAAGQPFTRDVAVEIAPSSGAALARLAIGKGLVPSSPGVVVGRLDSSVLPQGSYGPLRYRLVESGVAGDWQPLATLVRLPRIEGVTCPKGGVGTCTLTGRNLFLVSAVAGHAGFDEAISVPPGFTGEDVKVPRPAEGKLYLRLRDDAGAVATLDS